MHRDEARLGRGADQYRLNAADSNDVKATTLSVELHVAEHGSQKDEEEVEEEDEEVQEAAHSVMASELPPSCLDVTIALRYMVEHSCVDFHQVSANAFHLYCAWPDEVTSQTELMSTAWPDKLPHQQNWCAVHCLTSYLTNKTDICKRCQVRLRPALARKGQLCYTRSSLACDTCS